MISTIIPPNWAIVNRFGQSNAQIQLKLGELCRIYAIPIQRTRIRILCMRYANDFDSHFNLRDYKVFLFFLRIRKSLAVKLKKYGLKLKSI